MQLRADALDAHLSKSLASLYVISSDEHLLALEAADLIRASARAAFARGGNMMKQARTHTAWRCAALHAHSLEAPCLRAGHAREHVRHCVSKRVRIEFLRVAHCKVDEVRLKVDEVRAGAAWAGRAA